MMIRILKILFVVMLLTNCSEPPKPVFSVGEIVVAKLNNQKGMVVGYICNRSSGCRYYIRFSTVTTRTETHFLSPDDPIEFSPFSIVLMRAYEFERVK